MKEQGNEAVRGTAKAVWALPGMAMDLGVGARNLMAGQNANGQYPYELPSNTFNRFLDQYTIAPTSTAGKVGEFATSALLGSRLGGPTYTPSAVPGGGAVPANFAPPVTQAQQNLADVRNAGYALPPSTVKPSIPNKLLESIGGKTGTAQDASLNNMQVTNSLVRKALGMDPGAEITPQALKAIRTQAGSAKASLISESGPTVNLDDTYRQGIDNILAPYKESADELGDAFGNPALIKAGDALSKPQITPKVAMDAITKLRDQSKMAFRTGDNTTGVAYKGLATNLEDGIDRHLVAQGKPDVVDAYRNARQLQAKTYDVEDALNPDTGNVNANILKRADYLNGPLATAATAARIAPKATREIVDSGSVRNTDVMTGGLAAVMEKNPKFLLYPLARQAIRAGMLSPTGQKALLGPPRGLFSPATPVPTMSGMPQSLLGQWNLQNQ